VQRRRVGARHVQGPRAARGRPVRDRRGDDDRGIRDRREHRLPLLRGRVPGGRGRARRAIAAARGRPARSDILGSGFAFDIEVRRGAGAYICGEETALFESIEGKRGEPRNKPPFPVEVGLFGKPTVVNNVETLANIPLIVLEGGEVFAAIGTDGSTGPKLFCLAGNVARPGVYEVEFGATLRDLIDLAGASPVGATSGRSCSAVPRAPSWAEVLDTPLTFEATRAIGATLGSGVIMVFDETADLVDTLRRIAQFFRDESCGQCVPCRSAACDRRSCSRAWPRAPACGRGKTSWHCCARSARRCETHRSADWARRPRPPSSRHFASLGWWTI
jgi:NADH:ubiquinone oxidoreductase subunit F (NADH-binding)